MKDKILKEFYRRSNPKTFGSESLLNRSYGHYHPDTYDLDRDKVKTFISKALDDQKKEFEMLIKQAILLHGNIPSTKPLQYILDKLTQNK